MYTTIFRADSPEKPPGHRGFSEIKQKVVAPLAKFCYNITDMKITMGQDAHFQEARL